MANLEKQETLESVEEVANQFVKSYLDQYRLFKALDERMHMRGFRKYAQYFRRKVVMELAKTHTQTKIAEILGVTLDMVEYDVRSFHKSLKNRRKLKLYT